MRYSFFDKIELIDSTRAVGIKRLNAQDEVFQDHFPNFPILPAALMVESAVRLTEIWSWLVSETEKTFIPFLFKRFKFYKHAIPGDVLHVSVDFQHEADHENFPIHINAQGEINTERLFKGSFSGRMMDCKDFMSTQAIKNILHKLEVKNVHI